MGGVAFLAADGAGAGDLPSLESLTSFIHSTHSPHHLHQLHAFLLRRHLLPVFACHLISSFSRLHLLPSAVSLFHSLPFPPSPPSFTSLIRSLSDRHLFSQSLNYFLLLIRSGHRPCRLSLPFALRSAFASSLAASLHAVAVKPALDLDPFVRTSLAHAYLRLGLPHLALHLFDETPRWHKRNNVLLWNVTLNALCSSGDVSRARELFDEMPQRSVASWNCLVQGLICAGDLEGAVELFERMPERNVVSWTTVVSGLSRNGESDRAVGVFDRMVALDVTVNEFAIAAALSACGRMGALDKGAYVHEYALSKGIRADGAVGTALVDMYAKCGKIERAAEVFDGMQQRDVLAWTAMMMGRAVHGQWREALECFEDMRCACVAPDEGAFLAVLMACSHSGKVDKGMELFDEMTSVYNVQPTIKHYTCMVDMFGRAGRLDEALELITKEMPIEPDFVLWGALFTACQAHKNVEMAELVAERLLQLKPMHSGSYVFLSNMYSSTKRWSEAESIRTDMKKQSVEKSPGWSYIEAGGHPYRFRAGDDRSHPRHEEMYKELEELVKLTGGQGNMEEAEKEGNLELHGEKLALALGLVSTGEGEEIRIVQDSRVCEDCHSLMKLASLVRRREIVLRDDKRFHYFRGGVCSCGDYW